MRYLIAPTNGDEGSYLSSREVLHTGAISSSELVNWKFGFSHLLICEGSSSHVVYTGPFFVCCRILRELKAGDRVGLIGGVNEWETGSYSYFNSWVYRSDDGRAICPKLCITVARVGALIQEGAYVFIETDVFPNQPKDLEILGSICFVIARNEMQVHRLYTKGQAAVVYASVKGGVKVYRVQGQEVYEIPLYEEENYEEFALLSKCSDSQELEAYLSIKDT